MRIILEAMTEFSENHRVHICIIKPNTDPRSYDITRQIENVMDLELFSVLKSLPHQEFVSLIEDVLLLAGNSSIGVLEAPFYKFPCKYQS